MARMIPFPGSPFREEGREADEHTVMVPLARMHLRAISGVLRGRDFFFSGAPLVIGRAATCTISIPSHGVSRAHARVEYSDGGYWLIPEKTLNGTRVNGTLVQESRQLVEGDKIAIEDCTFVVTLQSPDAVDDDPIAAPPTNVEWQPPVRLSAPTIATVAAPPRISQPMLAHPPATGAMPTYPPTNASYPPQQLAYHARPTRPRWLVVAAIAIGLIGLVVAIVVVTAKLVAPATSPAQPPVAMPQVPVVITPARMPPPPPPPPKQAPASTGTLAIIRSPIAASVRGTLVDIAANGTNVSTGGAVAHVRLDSPAYKQAYAKLVSLQHKYGNSPDYADFIAQARQEFAAAGRRREVQPISVATRGKLDNVALKPGAELSPRQVIGDLVVARLTVPIAAIDGDGTRCVAQLATGAQLAGTMLAVGATERTLELDEPPTEAPGSVGELKVHCVQ
jgi:hypothetical protein